MRYILWDVFCIPCFQKNLSLVEQLLFFFFLKFLEVLYKFQTRTLICLFLCSLALCLGNKAFSNIMILAPFTVKFYLFWKYLKFLEMSYSIIFKAKNNLKVSLHRKCVKSENIIKQKKTEVLVQKIRMSICRKKDNIFLS